MAEIVALVKRSTRLFLRDRQTVFFSFLSTVIIIALYFLFIGGIYSDELVANSQGIFSVTTSNFVVYLQMMAGVLMLNSMSLSIGVFSVIATDFESRRVDGFLLAPISKTELLLAYLLSGFLVSFLLNLFTWFLSLGIIRIVTGYGIGLETILFCILILIFASLISCSIMLLIVAVVRSSNAIGVIGGISGTILGFLCGIYMPYSQLGEGTKMVGSFLPYTHLTIWMKRSVLGDAFSQLNVPAGAQEMLFRDVFSAENVGLAGLDVPLSLMLVFCGIFALICLVLAWTVLKKRIAGGS